MVRGRKQGGWKEGEQKARADTELWLNSRQRVAIQEETGVYDSGNKKCPNIS